MAAAEQIRAGDRAALTGVAFMSLAATLMALDAVIVRLLTPQLHPFAIGFGRAVFGLMAVLPFIVARPAVLRTSYRWMHLLRAALKLGSLVAFFAAFARAPLADVTAIAVASPLFVTLGAWLLLSEKPRRARILAMALGFVGVLIVLRPGQGGGATDGLALALLGAALTAAIQLLLKPMTARDPTGALVSWNLILTVPVAAVPAAFVWTAPSGIEWGLLALQGVLGAASMWLVTCALSLAEASLIVPFEFLRLPIVAAIAYALFAEAVPPATWIGGAAIFAGTVLMARTARRR